MNMYKWIDDTIENDVKKAIPVLTFPAIQKMDISVEELLYDKAKLAEGLEIVARDTDCGAVLSYMDLSLEAEAFGSEIMFSEDEVPAVVGALISTKEDADTLEVPDVETARIGLNIGAVEETCKRVQDRPVFAGCIGPFSLAGRLLDVSQAMLYCYTDPDMVHTVLDKASQFIIAYIKEYKKAGANGVVVAEPLAGLLSSDLAQTFSAEYVKKIVDEVQDENFIVIYHNCGNSTIKTIDTIINNGCRVFHFGNAINMDEIIKLIPEDFIVMGNIDPANIFRNGTKEEVYEKTTELLEKCGTNNNYVISSGCDIPPLSPWENIDAFFQAVDDYYKNK